MLTIPEKNLQEFRGPFYTSKEATYPEAVTLRASYLTHIFQEQLEEDLIDSQHFFEEVCRVFIDIFLEGDSDFEFSSELISEAHAKALVRTAIDDLKEEGIIDTVDDVDGEDIIFLTKKGREYCKNNNLEDPKNE